LKFKILQKIIEFSFEQERVMQGAKLNRNINSAWNQYWSCTEDLDKNKLSCFLIENPVLKPNF